MSFIASIFSAIIDVIVSIVEAVIQVVEMVVQLIMILLGWDSGSTQIIEYYEVHNVPLFDDVDNKNPLLQSVIRSVLEERDVASNLIYHTVFRSLKGNVREFLQFIDNGNYFENFPAVESYILTIDYTELTAALNTLNGVPCTPEGSYLRALSKKDWVQYWLQENKGYDVGANALGTEYREVTTGPFTPATDTHNITLTPGNIQLDITSAVAPSDDVLADMRWEVNLNTIVYNAVPDTYTIQAYNSAGVTITLPYTAPSKPTELHYVSFYYRDSDPSRQYIFIYKVGDGTYTDLDTVETPIDEDGSVLQTLPAVPLRISNSNYTTFGATKQAAIEDLLSIIHLDAEEILDAVINDSGVAAGDLDNVYVNFGVRMWDTSQAGMSYLFTMFENLYPSQGVSQGTYNNSPAGDDKPQNNILTTTDDNKAAFQWSYITYEHTSLVDIDANSGSPENGIYYSDMSRFGDDGLLKYNYYVSSGKGTYNVGYKADNLDEVQDFLDGNGVPNPGTTTTEAANWLQVTERMIYNNPSPSLLESDGSASTLTYLTGDLVYENSGSGVTALTVTGGGSGYSSPPTVAITGGGGSGATATAVLTAGAVSSITITAAGSGYTTLPIVTLTGGGGVGATATAGISGVLRLVESASDETTVGQSITYYCVKPSGLDAYTVVAPIGALKVIDGATGRFNMVKFNLGNKNDLMVPFVHNFIKDLSNTEVSKLFLAGAHVSIYIAHYEVIHHAGMSFLQALVMIIIIVVIVVITVMTGGAAGGTLGPILSAIGAGAFATAWSLFLAALPGMLMRMVVQYIIQIIITEIAGDNEMLAMILNLVAMVAMSAWEGNVSYGEGPPGTVQPGSYSSASGGTAINGAPGSSIEFTSTPKSFHFTGMTSFKSLSAFDYAMIAMEVMTGINTVNMNKVHAERDLLERDQEAFQKYHDQTEAEMAGRQSFMVIEPLVSSEYLNGYLRSKNNVGKIGAEKFYALNDAYHDVPYIGLTPNYDQKVSLGWQFE